MRKTIVALGSAALLTVAAAAPAVAAGHGDTPKNEGAACVQAGIGFLKENDLLKAAAKKQIDYSTIADAEAGPIFADLPAESFLSLGQVVKLHTTNPELFAWCMTPEA